MFDPDWKEIFIDNLPNTVDECFIMELFKSIGFTTKIKYTFKIQITQNKPVAYVTFEKHKTALCAISKICKERFKGIAIRANWTDPYTLSLIKYGNRALFIRGFDKKVKVSQLRSIFCKFGEIEECEIPLTNGKSRGYGHVIFTNEKDAKRARLNLNNSSINRKPIHIEFVDKSFENDQKNASKEQKNNSNSLFFGIIIKPLPYKFFKTNEDLANLLKEFGKFADSKDPNPRILLNEDGVREDIGYCHFRRAKSALRAVRELNDKMHESGEFRFQCYRSITSKERQSTIKKVANDLGDRVSESIQNRTLYAKNFDKNITEKEFEEYFKQFGDIESSHLRGRGCGFVTYKTDEGAMNAIENFIITPFKGETPFLSYFKKDIERELQKEEVMSSMSRYLIYFECYNTQITDDEFIEYFKQFGKIDEFTIERQILIDDDVGKITGTVKFGSSDEEEKAISSSILNHLKGNPIAVGHYSSATKNSTTYSEEYLSPVEYIKRRLNNHDITGRRNKAVLLTISNEQAFYLNNNTSLLYSWLERMKSIVEDTSYCNRFYSKNGAFSEK